MKAVVPLLLVFVCSWAGLTMGAEKEANPQQSLETAIPHAIRLLKAQQYGLFIESYMLPDDFKKMVASGKYDARQFGAKKAPRLLEVLEAVPTATLTLDNEKKIATYTFKEPIGGKSEIRFVKVDDLWYLVN